VTEYLKHFALNAAAAATAMLSLVLLVLGWGIVFGSIEPFLFFRDKWPGVLALTALVVVGYAHEMGIRRTRGSRHER
jgi:hypothetical protein